MITRNRPELLEGLDSKDSKKYIHFVEMGALSDGTFEALELYLADCSGLYLSNASLKNSRMRHVNLSNAILKNCNLSNVYAAWSYLEGIDLSGSILREANLEGADLEKANLAECDFRAANLEFSNLRGANLEAIVFDESTTLPNGEKWRSDIDLFRFTNEKHQQFDHNLTARTRYTSAAYWNKDEPW